MFRIGAMVSILVALMLGSVVVLDHMTQSRLPGEADESPELSTEDSGEADPTDDDATDDDAKPVEILQQPVENCCGGEACDGTCCSAECIPVVEVPTTAVSKTYFIRIQRETRGASWSCCCPPRHEPPL